MLSQFVAIPKKRGPKEGCTRSEEAKKSISRCRTGVKRKPFTDETKARMKASQQARRIKEADKKKLQTA